MKSQFTDVLVRMPTARMGDGLTTQTLGAPNLDHAMAQYRAYLDALAACGLDLHVLPGDEAYPDGHFVEDTAVLYGELAVMTQPGAPSRRGEIAAVAAALPHPVCVYMAGDAFLDGGDVLLCADRVLIGISKRTNIAGAEFLRSALMDYDAGLKVDFVPFDGVLHLKTGVTELVPGVLVRSPALKTGYAFDFAETVMLPPQETYAADVLPLNDHIIIPAGYPVLGALAARYYTQILPLAMTEFEKMDGGVTCLSLPYITVP